MRLPSRAPGLIELMGRSDMNAVLPRVIAAEVGPTINGAYLHWDDVRHRVPPDGLAPADWWLGVKLARVAMLREFPLHSVDGVPFRYSLPDEALELLHWIDQHAAGELAVNEAIPDVRQRRRYLVTSLMEEAITSSQLEGASTTRHEAKEMIRSGRQPRDRDEQMILNNYQAMTALSDMHSRDLDVDVVNSLHRILTRGTLSEPSAAGRPQRPGEERVRVFDPEGQVAHIPPPAEDLGERMQRMCDFANARNSGSFVHPVVRGILLHLWLAYDHPYEDGNGRTARALFYREMLRSGYWLFEYVSISRLLVRAPAQYARAFLFTESDEFDATYFVLHQLVTIRRALEEFHAYIERKMLEARAVITQLRNTELNNRQVALLTHAIRHSDADYTVTTHSTSHRVTRQSARTDLATLLEKGLLDRRRVGNEFHFHPPPDLEARVAALAAIH